MSSEPIRDPAIDHLLNAWEDVEFRHAVEGTARNKLIMTALWTEACLTFPTLDALDAGYEIYPVVDAVGGTSAEAHRAITMTMRRHCGRHHSGTGCRK
jgi:nicotinamidase-related amidase